MKRVLISILVAYAFSSQHLIAQEATLLREDRNQLTIGVGFIGLLYLDEWLNETPFTRIAFPPVFVQYDRQLGKRFSVGAYMGFEYEKQSGTYKDFNGPTTSFVGGGLIDFHPIRYSKRKFLDPYIGLSFFYYDSSGLEKNIMPGLRIGCNIKLYKQMKMRINAGAGTALFETGLTYNF